VQLSDTLLFSSVTPSYMVFPFSVKMEFDERSWIFKCNWSDEVMKVVKTEMSTI
jgi:hypothetical protein